MSGNANAATSTRAGTQISGSTEATTATASAAKPKDGDDRAPSLRPHDGLPDYVDYRYGYPPIPGRMFGSGN